MSKNLLLTIATLAVMSSCTTESVLDSASMQTSEKMQVAKDFISKIKYDLQITPKNGQSLRAAFKVSQNDLLSLLSTRQKSRGLSSAIHNIEPVVYDKDTIMYLVNYNKGWKLYSVDKRMPVVLAENFIETGKKAEDLLKNKSIDFWISDIAKLTKSLAETDEYDRNAGSLKVWATQNGGIKRIPTQPVPGEYIYVGMEEVNRKTIICPHLTKTLWHGETPFNAYCPSLDENTLEKSKAGCVAVSTAQYLYFLQDQKGYTFQMPRAGTCTGGYKNGYTQSFTDFSTWNLKELALTDNYNLYTPEQMDNVALVLGYIGKETDMNYSANDSYATYPKTQAFLNKMGVKGKFVSEKDIDLNRIIFGQKNPVITRGVEDGVAQGHMFLIDGGKYEIAEYEYIWRFLEDTTFYDPDRYGVILRESAGSFNENYSYQCNMGYNSLFINGYDGDDTYYVITKIMGFNKDRLYFKRED